MSSPWPMRWAGALLVTGAINLIVNTVFPSAPIWVVLLVELVSAAGMLLTPLVLDAARQRGERHTPDLSNRHQPESGQ